MRLGILECDHVDDEYRSIAGDYRDMFTDLLGRQRRDLDFAPYDACRGTLPGSPSECDAWLITGSRCSVYDEVEWIADLSGFVRRLRDAASPCIGICFGHQLLAHALGGRADRAPGGWGAGAHQIALLASAPWMDPYSPTCDLLFMHQDQVVAVPPGGAVLGQTDHCPVAVLGVGRSMLGVQAHPEFPAAYVDALLSDRVERVGAEQTSAARRSLAGPIEGDRMGRWLIRFIEEAMP